MAVSPTSSGAGIVAFTTPWVPPPNCSDHYTATTAVTGGLRPTTITVLASLPTNNPTCQPEGWNDANLEDRLFLFSPAVCPSGWTAYQLGVGETYNRDAHATRIFSYATCCSRYVFLRWNFSSVFNPMHVSPVCIYGICKSALANSDGKYSGFTVEAIGGIPEETSGIVRGACVQEVTTALTLSSAELPVKATTNDEGHEARDETSSTSLASDFYTNGIRAHYPWIIRWQATDIGSLTPAPPDLGSTSQCIVLRTWIPGETVDPSSRIEAHQNSDNSDSNYGSLLAVIIVPTVVGGLVLIGCVTFCIVRHKKRKKRRDKPPPELPRARDPPVNVLDPVRT